MRPVTGWCVHEWDLCDGTMMMMMMTVMASRASGGWGCLGLDCCPGLAAAWSAQTEEA